MNGSRLGFAESSKSRRSLRSRLRALSAWRQRRDSLASIGDVEKARYRIELQAPSALPHLPVDPNGKPHLPRDPRLDDPTSSNRGSFFSAGARDALSGTKTRNLCASSRRRGVGYGRLVKPASAFTHRRCASSPRLDRRPHSASGGRIGDGFDQRSVHDRVGRDHTARVCVVGLAIIEQHARVVGELAAGAMHQRIDRRGVP